MSVRDVKNAFSQVTMDRRIDSRDVDTILTSAGSISKEEQAAIKQEADKFAGMMDPAAKRKLQSKLGEVDDLRAWAAQQNRRVQVSASRLSGEAEKLLAPGVATKSFGGSEIPEAVKQVVTDALKGGAIAYDVRELKPDPVYDTSHGEPEMTVEGKFNPYSQQSKATDSLAFSHTELTPKKIADDMNTPQTLNVLKGYKGSRQDAVAEFEKVTIKGNGRITELYDEAHWPDTLARGPGGQKYASNFAILADGSVHAVPASRRSKGDPGLILTTASLGRGKQMLFNGHLHMENGVVNYVGMSGRLGKLKEDGAKFVDPVAILKAWGFQVTPGLTVTQE
ncbi:MAG: hypothetical protein IT380_25075 [Myxococcales bacterium]|nr:hypothetical protein [Myxococcales bacterium]